MTAMLNAAFFLLFLLTVYGGVWGVSRVLAALEARCEDWDTEGHDRW